MSALAPLCFGILPAAWFDKVFAQSGGARARRDNACNDSGLSRRRLHHGRLIARTGGLPGLAH
tara:strand:+ start:12962 stop:13150 length:189 start_codon:yes stop_codon:yes gene_type:complete